MEERTAGRIKDGILGALTGGVLAFAAGILLTHLFFLAGTQFLFSLYPDHFFLQKLVRPLVEKHAFFLSTLDYYYDHYITSVGTAELALEVGILGWTVNVGRGTFAMGIYFPFLSTLLTPAVALVVGGWVAGRIMGVRAARWHPWAGAAVALPYAALLWWGRHYVTTQSKKFAVTFATIFKVLPSFQMAPVEWQIWVWGLLFGAVFGGIGGYWSAREILGTKDPPLVAPAWAALSLAWRSFLVSGAGVILFGLVVALTAAGREQGKWLGLFTLLAVAILVWLARRRWVTWGSLLLLVLVFFGLMLSHLYLAHGATFQGRLAWRDRAPGEGKMRLGLLDGYPGVYSVKELFSLKGYFSLSEIPKMWRRGLARQEPFPWYWKLLPLIPCAVLGWHGYRLGQAAGGGFRPGWVGLLAAWYTAFLLLFLPFAENRFQFLGSILGLNVKLAYTFAPEVGQVAVHGFLLAFLAAGFGCGVEWWRSRRAVRRG